jgi:hypothetical protein
MEAIVTEIAPEVFRLGIAPDNSPVNFACFLIRDEQPAMIETGYFLQHGMFNLIYLPLKNSSTRRAFGTSLCRTWKGTSVQHCRHFWNGPHRQNPCAAPSVRW